MLVDRVQGSETSAWSSRHNKHRGNSDELQSQMMTQCSRMHRGATGRGKCPEMHQGVYKINQL